MKLLGSTKSKITSEKTGENATHSEITELVLIHYNIVNSYYQHDSRVLYTFIPIKSIGQLLHISTKKYMFLRILIQNFDILKHGLLIKILNH